jgi:hypothetical protein
MQNQLRNQMKLRPKFIYMLVLTLLSSHCAFASGYFTENSDYFIEIEVFPVVNVEDNELKDSMPDDYMVPEGPSVEPPMPYRKPERKSQLMDVSFPAKAKNNPVNFPNQNLMEILEIRARIRLCSILESDKCQILGRFQGYNVEELVAAQLHFTKILSNSKSAYAMLFTGAVVGGFFAAKKAFTKMVDFLVEDDGLSVRAAHSKRMKVTKYAASTLAASVSGGTVTREILAGPDDGWTDKEWSLFGYRMGIDKKASVSRSSNLLIAFMGLAVGKHIEELSNIDPAKLFSIQSKYEIPPDQLLLYFPFNAKLTQRVSRYLPGNRTSTSLNEFVPFFVSEMAIITNPYRQIRQ